MHRQGSMFMLFMLTYILFMVFAGFPWLFSAMGVGEQDAERLMASPWFLIAQQLALLLAPLLIWVFARREPAAGFIKARPVSLRNAALIFLICIFIQPGMMFVSGLASLFSPNVIAEVAAEAREHPFWLVLLAMAVTPSIVEELVFRGYVQSRYEGLGVGTAAIASGIFFGIIHLNIQQFFYAFALGVVFSYIVHYTGSIFAGMLAHFVINGSQLSLARLAFMLEDAMHGMLPEDGIPLEAAEVSPAVAVAVVGAFALVSTPLALYFLKTLIKRCRTERAAEMLMEAAGPKAKGETGVAKILDMAGVFDGIEDTNGTNAAPDGDEPNSAPVVRLEPNPYTDLAFVAVIVIFLALMVAVRIG